MPEPVTIVGGGLAGLSLGIGLRQRGIPVTVWEAGRYPRHHVCGEFISGAGQRSLERLALLDGIVATGGRWAESAIFVDGQQATPSRPLQQPALCISRHVLDTWLAREFERLGGDLREAQRWSGDVGAAAAAGVVLASGRRTEKPADGWRLFALKVHARDLELAADLEMHMVPQGYVGLCRLADGEVNICGFFRSRETVPGLRQDWQEWLAGPADSLLHERLAAATLLTDSQCAVAGFSLRPVRATDRGECCIGDALTMIPPVTGNGMSMAFESAELAIEPLASWSRGDRPWEATRAAISVACDARFRRRLRWGWWLQQALLHPTARRAVVAVATRTGRLAASLFARTR